jgi:hypothetical protein
MLTSSNGQYNGKVINETLLEMNYDTGEYKRIKNIRHIK